MTYLYQLLFPVMWLSWVACWWLASRRTKPTVRGESVPSRLSHVAPFMLAAVLLALPNIPISILDERYLPFVPWPFWVGAGLTLAGLVFAAWARVRLGGNWSGTVTLKENHELVTSGPYSIVRHPVYTGLLVGFVGSALARAEWRGILAVAVVLWSFQRKMKIEEQWMREQFGGAYEAYAKRVAALFPFVL
jgi:protein-S-isoprenylcysteine O-methyltransferase Ste14